MFIKFLRNVIEDPEIESKILESKRQDVGRQEGAVNSTCFSYTFQIQGK